MVSFKERRTHSLNEYSAELGENGNSKNRTDITFQNGTQTIYVEIKNWCAVASQSGTKYLLQPKFKQQFTYYLEKTNSMNGFVYVFKIRGSVTEAKIKSQFQEIFRGTQNSDGTFKYEFFDIFWNNQALRRNIWTDVPPNPTQIDRATYLNRFIALVGVNGNTNSSLYNFINIK